MSKVTVILKKKMSAVFCDAFYRLEKDFFIIYKRHKEYGAPIAHFKKNSVKEINTE